jgi:hypothetical protein
MPYGSVSEAEKKNPGLKKYSDKAKRGWLSALNKCLKDGSAESKCFAIAYSVANKAQKKAHQMEMEGRIARIASCVASKERLAMSFVEEARAVKLKARALEFFQSVKNFKGDLNDFLRDMTSAVRDPRSLQEFPEIRDVISLSEFLKKGVLRHTFLSEQDISLKMQQVVERDSIE